MPNSMQRTIATAQYFSSGFMPIANLRVYHRYSASKMDPIFHPRLTKVSKEFEDEALKQITTMGLKDGISKNLDSNYKFLSKVLNMKESNVCKQGTCNFDDYNTKITFKLGDEPKMSGSLKLATQAAGVVKE